MEGNKKKLKWSDVLNRNLFLRAIPLAGINGKAICDIIMLQVHYDKANKTFNDRINDGLKKLKEEKFPKFDEESQKKEEDRCEEYKAWLDELNKLYNDMRNAELDKDVEDVTVPDITRDTFTSICETGVEGDIKLFDGQDNQPVMIPKIELLRVLGAMVKD